MSLTIDIPTETQIRSYRVIATIAATSPHWRRLGGNGKPEEIVATILSVMLFARELGFSPMIAISGGIHNVEGKYEISARLMNAAIRMRGHKIQIQMSTDEVCVIWGKRKDTGEEFSAKYTMEDAARAGLIRDKGGWKKCPKDMLFARAISRLTRQLFADCIGGAYVEGELQETILGKVVDKVDVPTEEELNSTLPVEEKSPQFTIPEGINASRIDIFIQETAIQNEKPIDIVKQRAAANMSGFLEVFKAWEEKRFASPSLRIQGCLC